MGIESRVFSATCATCYLVLALLCDWPAHCWWKWRLVEPVWCWSWCWAASGPGTELSLTSLASLPSSSLSRCRYRYICMHIYTYLHISTRYLHISTRYLHTCPRPGGASASSSSRRRPLLERCPSWRPRWRRQPGHGGYR